MAINETFRNKAVWSLSLDCQCPGCGTEYDVDTYEDGVIECVCDIKFEYDNRHPEKAEIV